MDSSASMCNWMESIKKEISQLTLSQMVIPGTHDSATFNMRYQVLSKDFFKALPGFYARCQFNSANFRKQLEDGIRYFDLRVKYVQSHPRKAKGSPFRLVHGVFNTNVWIDEPFQEIREFLDQNTNEFIFIEFRRVYGFKTDQVFQKLSDLIQGTFGDILVSKYEAENSPIESLLQTKKRLVVIFPHDSAQKFHKNYIGTLHNSWKNKYLTDELIPLLEKEELQPRANAEQQGIPACLHVLCVNLTPNKNPIVASNFLIAFLLLLTIYHTGSVLLVLLLALIWFLIQLENTPALMVALLHPRLQEWFETSELARKHMNIFMLDYYQSFPKMMEITFSLNRERGKNKQNFQDKLSRSLQTRQ